ncbi:hypothetical protein B0H65DRAFT_521988 [Neurospora tetraspora]|uniref:Uncharacterized protein n=1 Tax=Neurospora tetraspora TaxID=94610 RepID=A0AAE0MU17_9PEZI|nr:hypothetical protein B0H65DRAFT_521988 [Neurospora tetraspora]
MSVDSSGANTAVFPRTVVFDRAQGKAVPNDRLHPHIVLPATETLPASPGPGEPPRTQASHRDGTKWKILRLPDGRVTSSVHTLSRHRLSSIVP